MTAAIPIAGAGLSAYGDLQQGKMTSESLNKQADSLEAQAVEAHQKGEYDAMRNQMIASQKIGTSIASYGASGVSAQSGSVLDVIAASHQNAELDKMNIIHGADIRAINYQNQASMNRYGAASAIQGSYWKALGALTMGAVNVSQAGAGSAPKAGGSGEGAGLESSNADLSGMGEEAGGAGGIAGEAGSAAAIA